MSVREERPKQQNLLDMIDDATDKLGRELGLIEDEFTMPPVDSQAFEQIRVTKLMNEDVMSECNEPLTRLETMDGFELQKKTNEQPEKPSNSQSPITIPIRKKVDQFKRMQVMLEEDKKKAAIEPDPNVLEDDVTS